MLSLANDGTIDRVLSLASGGTIDRVLSLANDGTIARVLSLANGGTIARVLSLANDGTIDRVLSLANDGTIDRLKKIKEVKGDPKIYTKMLVGINSLACAFKENGIEKTALNMKDWHGAKTSCGSSHCMGGWAVHCTEGGYELEKLYGTLKAATIILRRSHPDKPLPNFSGDVPNEAALAFIQARANEEK